MSWEDDAKKNALIISASAKNQEFIEEQIKTMEKYGYSIDDFYAFMKQMGFTQYTTRDSRILWQIRRSNHVEFMPFLIGLHLFNQFIYYVNTGTVVDIKFRKEEL